MGHTCNRDECRVKEWIMPAFMNGKGHACIHDERRVTEYGHTCIYDNAE